MQRNLITKNGNEKVSYIQIIGFILIGIGVIYIASFLLPNGFIDYLPSLKLDEKPIAEGMAISFFIIMLGVSFAFPSLLEGNNGLSTMRIVVFMITNVMCLLLIKIGWGKDSLAHIGLDQYWMGIIAFVFGAKATQSFFESRMAVAKQSESNGSEPAVSSEIIEEAIKKHAKDWIRNVYSPNVIGVSSERKYIEDKQTNLDCILFEVKKKNSDIPVSKRIPAYIEFISSDHRKYMIPTDVKEIGNNTVNSYINGKPNVILFNDFQLGCSVSRKNENLTGSLGLLVKKSGQDAIYLLGCYHVFCATELSRGKNNFSNVAVTINDEIIAPSKKDKGFATIARLKSGIFNEKNDFAIAQKEDDVDVINNIPSESKKIKPGEIIWITKNDENKLPLITYGRTSNSQRGLVKSSYSEGLIKYPDGKNYYLKGLIKTEKISDSGDSGAPVFDESGGVAGLIISGSNEYSYILSVNQFLIDHDLEIITS